MSKADEMFEKLGYKKEENNMGIKYIEKGRILGDSFNFEIFFAKTSKLIGCTGLVTIKELQAINKKVEELRMDEINIHIQTNEPEKLLLEILKIILQSNKQEWWEM